jgi:methylmalonyl-CoA mutase C-terminal domain/subunit
MSLLKQKGMNDVTVLLGGTIPAADIPALKQAGIAEIFLPGTSTQDIVNFVRQNAARKTA